MRPSILILFVSIYSQMVMAQCPTIPNLSAYNVTSLPNPFTFLSGAPVVTTADWACKQAEISTLLQQNELGLMPLDPQSVTASFSASSKTITITVSDQGKTLTFSPTITYPSGGSSTGGPYPAIIGIGGISIPQPSGVAVINFDNSGMAEQNDATSRGQGLFFQLYGTNATAGAMMAWAWGVRRIMDALTITPSTGIDVTRVAVSGCSRNGKGALVAGAFEPRIVLTIPQESGSGGTDTWRISDWLLAGGLDTQTASEIIQENVWFSTAFNQFATSSVDRLPFDHHQLIGLVAPRGFFAIDNLGYDWLGPQSSYGALVAARTIWTTLGAQANMGFSQSANHSHCVFPSSQQADLSAFIGKFLLRQSTNTNITETAGTYTFPVPNSMWAPWTPPASLTSSNGTTSTTSVSSSSMALSSSTTTSTTISSLPSGVVAHWNQCGGIGYAGPTMCLAPYTCTQLNPYFYQCL
ncbi:hypothetical protein HMN09_00988000 [Mycena chlorophos]|uniref:(4-O-methyl)-D-glucuronate--lignin esterase n=1 Tax=Mycena chlorophos TaxID=658473 RepID=A0A8H6SL34_MYCCL|nr:hypothetical protein HMN09_00988000 [Mycena chlorophos]